MIYPTARTILIATAIAPTALLIGVAAPAIWPIGLGLLALLLALAAIDAAAGPRMEDADAACEGPQAVGVGERFAVAITVSFACAAPPKAQAALEVEGPIALLGCPSVSLGRADPGLATAIPLTALRRGAATVARLWLRWPGPLGLVWKQSARMIGAEIVVTPDIRAVRDASLRFNEREAMFGLSPRLHVGEGAELEALTDYRQGMDRRAIDWKQSARHTRLVAREYRTERNNHVVLAVDAGRAMSAPLGGVPRVDRAVAAALLTAYVALKDGDRVGLFGFDSRPRVVSKALSGRHVFPVLQRLAAGIDYSDQETNYTLALTTLAARLHRRSLVVVFTEFADTISAELMLAAVAPLLKRHLVLFVVLRDEELERMTAAAPASADHVSEAVIAHALLGERKLVLTRLRHIGVHVIEASPENAGPALLEAYLGFKRRDML